MREESVMNHDVVVERDTCCSARSTSAQQSSITSYIAPSTIPNATAFAWNPLTAIARCIMVFADSAHPEGKKAVLSASESFT